ncbi:lysosomal membrane ascorbate-dependent ferrireductase CYB561A3 isoform X2 [Callorhinchus milii]|uniref:Lysosomal membrane ascorbate-dependent ferrireductase CYB561A3 n=1 Tax=Callorhinchus milii TaxID=7868 RepID=V9KI08_CALMI|nr:lysosomal membrane ascorbate-dependent ferrireductase CYB561A3 isoform X2 [Callorhinchus milii]|eukprot:gi/632940958/ref/XP_007885611.1/ PREDICTED: cytochrome b ascorbate-dependent protein 3 isoform X2 [Callorhinchus milii]
MKSSSQFYLTYTCSLLLGLLCVTFVIYWNKQYRGGFAWDGSGKMFNWHPVCMVTGLVVLYGNAVLVYRLPFTQSSHKLLVKLAHATLNLLVLSLAVTGLVAVFEFHNKNQIPNLYSIHSWVGLSVVILFCFQWLLGFLSFLLPCTPLWFRAAYLDIHVFFGICIMGLSLVACHSGINEKLIFVLNTPNSTAPYAQLPSEAVFVNVLGVLLLGFSGTVTWMLYKREWRRKTPQETETLQPLLADEN